VFGFGKLIYPVFGVAVLLGYAHCVRRGIEPFEANSEKHSIAGMNASRTTGYGGGYYYSPVIFRYGGLGGK